MRIEKFTTNYNTVNNYYLHDEDVKKLNDSMPDDVTFKFILRPACYEKDGSRRIFIRLKNTKGLNSPEMNVSISKEYKKLLENFVKETYHTGICWDRGWFLFNDRYEK